MAGANRSQRVIRVNIDQQKVEAYEGGKQVYRFDGVSGDRCHPTDRGTFRILRKERLYRSRTYDVQMNSAMFFTYDGKALHQYHGPLPLWAVRAARQNFGDTFGSHGCVRLSEDDARRLFDWAGVGTTVEVR